MVNLGGDKSRRLRDNCLINTIRLWSRDHPAAMCRACSSSTFASCRVRSWSTVYCVSRSWTAEMWQKSEWYERGGRRLRFVVHHVHELGRWWQGAAQDSIRHQRRCLQAADVGHVLPAKPHWLQRADQHVCAGVVCRLLVVRYQRQQRPHVLQHRTWAVRFLLQRNKKGEEFWLFNLAPSWEFECLVTISPISLSPYFFFQTLPMCSFIFIITMVGYNLTLKYILILCILKIRFTALTII